MARDSVSRGILRSLVPRFFHGVLTSQVHSPGRAGITLRLLFQDSLQEIVHPCAFIIFFSLAIAHSPDQ